MTSNVSTPRTAVGLRIREKNPVIPDFGWPHTAYFENVWEAIEAAQAYPLDEYELAIVFEELTPEGWKVVETQEVARMDGFADENGRIGKENWNELEFGYDYSQNDILWNYDRDAGELTTIGELRGEEVKITFAATAEEWSHVAYLIEYGDCDAVDEWHMAHIVSVEVD